MENQEEMLLFRVLTISGRKVRSEDIRVLPLRLLKEPVKNSCGIITMKNPIEVLPTYPRDLLLMNTRIPEVILIFPLQEERSPLSEELILMVESKSMVVRISSVAPKVSPVIPRLLLFLSVLCG